MTSSETQGSEQAGEQGFLVEYGGKLYRTHVVQECDPQDQQMQAALQNASEAGKAVVYPSEQQGSDISYKSMEASPDGDAATFANTEPPIQS
jgi:hypothetical protein